MFEAVPKTQRAAIFDEHDGPVQIREIPVPEIGAEDILVKVQFSGVCHTDLHVWKGDFPIATKKTPIAGGHEGAGIVVKVGANVTNFKVGQKAGIKWLNGSCLACEFCKRGFETVCTNTLVTGLTRDGTFQQYAAVKGSEATPIPEKLDMALVAPILCAGVTVYRALKEANLAAGQIVAITGAGGGLGSLAIQYAVAMGYRVLAIDVGDKEKYCYGLGAEFFIDPFSVKNLPDAVREATNGGPHSVLCIAAADISMTQACEYVRTKGTVVLIALPRDGKCTLNVFWTVLRMITVKGSYVGSRQDATEALDFVARGFINVPHKIVPLEELPATYEEMIQGKIRGRVILDMWK